MISVHTSPLDQPGTGEAGGMNVYVLELARHLSARNIAVDVYTRATARSQVPQVEAYPGVQIHNVHAGPLHAMSKDDLQPYLWTFAREVLRTVAAHQQPRYDVIHSHYWLSGQVGAVLADRWRVPLAHSMHTMAKVKNAALATGDLPESSARVFCEELVVDAAHMLIANTDEEALQLVNLYDADPTRVEVIYPGVDLNVFGPGDQRAARVQLGLRVDAHVLLFAGRIQPLKAPDVLLRAVATLIETNPDLRTRLVVAVVGGPYGAEFDHPQALARMAESLGIQDVVRFVPPVSHPVLAQWYAAATLVCVPSYNESFGLVALEAQAVGTPVVAAAVGGLKRVVRDGVSGLLVGGHNPADYAHVIERLIRQPHLRAALSAGAVRHAARFAWERTAERSSGAYQRLSRHSTSIAELSRAGSGGDFYSASG
jgi:D-inositol-3-phosphate glycosyltransferase